MPDEPQPPWTAPAWFAPYRSCIVGFDPRELEEHLNRTKHRGPDQMIQSMMAEAQVKLLERLMAEGLLLVEKPARRASDIL